MIYKTRIIRRFVVSGRVQGVGFRAHVASGAARLGLTGWTRNCGADKVEAVVAGDEAALAEFAALMRRGPASAHVASFSQNEATEADLALGGGENFVVLASI